MYSQCRESKEEWAQYREYCIIAYSRWVLERTKEWSDEQMRGCLTANTVWRAARQMRIDPLSLGLSRQMLWHRPSAKHTRYLVGGWLLRSPWPKTLLDLRRRVVERRKNEEKARLEKEEEEARQARLVERLDEAEREAAPVFAILAERMPDDCSSGYVSPIISLSQEDAVRACFEARRDIRPQISAKSLRPLPPVPTFPSLPQPAPTTSVPAALAGMSSALLDALAAKDKEAKQKQEEIAALIKKDEEAANAERHIFVLRQLYFKLAGAMEASVMVVPLLKTLRNGNQWAGKYFSEEGFAALFNRVVDALPNAFKVVIKGGHDYVKRVGYRLPPLPELEGKLRDALKFNV
jgi:hypothetical protein